MPTQAFIFDLDGVLISSVEMHWYGFRQAFAAEGVEFTREHYLKVGVGAARENVIRTVMGDITKSKLDVLMTEKERHANEFLETQGLDPLPGSLEFVRRVHKHELRTAVATASRTPQPFLKAIGATELFPIVLDRQSTTRPKPEPDIYLLAAERLQLKPQECVVVEDSPPGVASARAAGMRVIAVTTTHKREALTAATATFSSFDEINVDDWV